MQADLLDETSFSRGRPEGYDAAYYLVPLMLGGGDFEDATKRARNFATKANEAGIGHVIYLGGIQPEEEEGKQASPTCSRAETGRVLGTSAGSRDRVRAGPIIDPVRRAFEMVRYLTERLPVMLTPRWVKNTVQLVSVRDVLEYLEASLDVGPSGIVPIGRDRLTFRELMQTYAGVRADQASHPANTIPGSATGHAGWVCHTDPEPPCGAADRGVVRPLTADTAKARDLFPEVKPLSTEVAVRRAPALHGKEHGRDALDRRWLPTTRSTSPTKKACSARFGVSPWTLRRPRCIERSLRSAARSAGWRSTGSGGSGRARLLIGGPGLRRGRRHPFDLDEGEALDFWRVEKVQPPESLRLRAEMRLPGRAWLQWKRNRTSPTRTERRCSRRPRYSNPRACPFLYWYAMYPAHLFIFAPWCVRSGDGRSAASRTRSRRPMTRSGSLNRPDRSRRHADQRSGPRTTR